MIASAGPCFRRVLLHVGVLVAVLAESSIGFAQNTTPKVIASGGMADAKLDAKTLSVLGGRLTIQMPAGAKVEARPFDIMSAPQSEERETRAIFDAGDERLVLLATESFAMAGVDLEKEVKAYVELWAGKYRVTALAKPVNGLKAVAVIPLNDPDRTRSDDSAFVEGLYIQSEDGTIQSLDVYVNLPAEKDMASCHRLAREILHSVKPGPNTHDLKPGNRRLFAFSDRLEISVDVPAKTIATRQVGPDFLVYRLTMLGTLVDPQDSILIYVGGHPTYHPGEKRGEGKIFGESVAWQTFRDGSGLQTLCPLDIPGDRKLFAHVIISARGRTQLDLLKTSADSFKLVERPAGMP